MPTSDGAGQPQFNEAQMKRGEPLGEDDLASIVAFEIAHSLAYDDTELATKRERTIQYMRGEMPDWPAEEGRSSVVSRDTSDVISWMLPGIIRLFTASDMMAIAEPVEPGDDKWAKQATDGINYAFWKDNPGYQILYNATYNALAHANGPVKHWWDETPKTKVSFHSGLTDEQLTLLTTPEYQATNADGSSEETIEILAHETKQAQIPAVDPQSGQMTMQQVALHDVKIRRTVKCGRVKIEAMAPEDFLIDSDATCIADARMKGNKKRVTRSSLIEMGFDYDKVMSLVRDDQNDTDVIRRNYTTQADSATEATEMVTLYHLFIDIDVDGDGVTEEVEFYYAGVEGAGSILDWQVWEDEPMFSDIPCQPVPHRYEGRSIWDDSYDIQEVKTVLTREGLNSLYASNNPQRFVAGRVINPDELNNPSFGGTVFGDQGTTVTPLTVPFVGAQAFDALRYFDEVLEKRTGVSRTTMALDPETLQNQTATAAQLQHDSAYSKIELIARNMAELGWSQVFRNIMKLMVRHQDRARTIRLRDQWIEIDPRYWNADMDVTINTGVGTGSRDRDQAQLAAVKQDQVMIAEAFKQAGRPDKAVEMIPKLLETMKKSAEAAGIKNPEQFYPMFTAEDVQQTQQQLQQSQGQPDPKTQAQIQADQAKAQSDSQIKGQQMQQDFALQMERMNREFALRKDQQDREFALKQWQIEQELALKERTQIAQFSIGQGVSNGASSDIHIGGQPG